MSSKCGNLSCRRFSFWFWHLPGRAVCTGAESSDGGCADAGAQAGSAPPLTITLQDALKRARKNDPQFRSAVTDVGLAHEDRVQARAALLPDTNFNTSYIYTQGQTTLHWR